MGQSGSQQPKGTSPARDQTDSGEGKLEEVGSSPQSPQVAEGAGTTSEVKTKNEDAPQQQEAEHDDEEKGDSDHGGKSITEVEALTEGGTETHDSHTKEKDQSGSKSVDGPVVEQNKETSDENITPRLRRTSFYETIDANEILPYLIIGNLASAKNERFLSRKNVRFILNLTNEPVETAMKEIEYMSILLEDDDDQDVSYYFEDCFTFINKAKPQAAQLPSKRKRSKNSISEPSAGVVLVHSYFGLSRTSAIVLGYLMKDKNWTLREAYDFLKERHPSAQPNDNFIVQLLRYEQEIHNGKMSMTLKDFYQQR